jgi:hypothetical protein
MGLFDWLSGKKATAAAPARDPVDEDEDVRWTGSQPIHGPPEFVRAAEMQRAYWTHDPEEQARLEAQGAGRLGWRDRLRLHHLFCLQHSLPGPQRAAATGKCRETVRRLVAADSPYRPRAAMVWQGQSADSTPGREPDLQGEFLNPSLTHLGCLEIYRLDAANQPVAIDFVSFDELSGVVFGPPTVIRAAKLFRDDGREEVVLVPLLYGVTWSIGEEYDRAGQMTRFVAHLDDVEIGAAGASGIGVGQQDLCVRAADGGSTLFGIGSVAEISFPLDMRDPRFDEKARSRGIDPDEVRARIGGS